MIEYIDLLVLSFKHNQPKDRVIVTVKPIRPCKAGKRQGAQIQAAEMNANVAFIGWQTDRFPIYPEHIVLRKETALGSIHPFRFYSPQLGLHTTSLDLLRQAIETELEPS